VGRNKIRDNLVYGDRPRIANSRIWIIEEDDSIIMCGVLNRSEMEQDSMWLSLNR
jgi:uncharacterized protein YunC (DUF1805 family)